MMTKNQVTPGNPTANQRGKCDHHPPLHKWENWGTEVVDNVYTNARSQSCRWWRWIQPGRQFPDSALNFCTLPPQGKVPSGAFDCVIPCCSYSTWTVLDAKQTLKTYLQNEESKTKRRGRRPGNIDNLPWSHSWKPAWPALSWRSAAPPGASHSATAQVPWTFSHRSLNPVRSHRN